MTICPISVVLCPNKDVHIIIIIIIMSITYYTHDNGTDNGWGN